MFQVLETKNKLNYGITVSLRDILQAREFEREKLEQKYFIHSIEIKKYIISISF